MASKDDNEPIPLNQEGLLEPKERISSSKLFIVGSLGLLLVIAAFVVALNLPELNNIWSSVSLDVGTTVLLFAVLFYVERSLVKREVRGIESRLLERLTPEDMVEQSQEVSNFP